MGIPELMPDFSRDHFVPRLSLGIWRGCASSEGALSLKMSRQVSLSIFRGCAVDDVSGKIQKERGAYLEQ